MLGKNISKNLSEKYGQKLLDHDKKNLQQMQLTLPQKSNSKKKKKSEARGVLIGNKIADKITKVSKVSPQKNLEIV